MNATIGGSAWGSHPVRALRRGFREVSDSDARGRVAFTRISRRCRCDFERYCARYLFIAPRRLFRYLRAGRSREGIPAAPAGLHAASLGKLRPSLLLRPMAPPPHPRAPALRRSHVVGRRANACFARATVLVHVLGARNERETPLRDAVRPCPRFRGGVLRTNDAPTRRSPGARCRAIERRKAAGAPGGGASRVARDSAAVCRGSQRVSAQRRRRECLRPLRRNDRRRRTRAERAELRDQRVNA